VKGSYHWSVLVEGEDEETVSVHIGHVAEKVGVKFGTEVAANYYCA
jgi:DNA-binding CsgD family transcriptional regulator